MHRDSVSDYSVVAFINLKGTNKTLLMKGVRELWKFPSGQCLPHERDYNETLLRILARQVGIRDIPDDHIHAIGMERRSIKRKVSTRKTHKHQVRLHEYPEIIFHIFLDIEWYLDHQRQDENLEAEFFSHEEILEMGNIIEHHRELYIEHSDWLEADV